MLDAAQRRVGQLAHHLVVVDPQHGNVFRHPQPDRPAGLQDVAGTVIVCGHQPQRLLQRLQPFRQVVLEVDPFPHGRGVPGIDGARRPMLLRTLLEGDGPLRTPGIRVRKRKAAKSKPGEAAFDQVFDAKPAESPIVGAEIWNPRSGIMPRGSPFDSHRRQPGFASRLGQALGVNRQNDPVALPITQVGKLVERLILDVQTPIADLMHIGADPPEDFPVVGSLEMDHHGNLPPLGHRNLPNAERRNAACLQVYILSCDVESVNVSSLASMPPRSGFSDQMRPNRQSSGPKARSSLDDSASVLGKLVIDIMRRPNTNEIMRCRHYRDSVRRRNTVPINHDKRRLRGQVMGMWGPRMECVIT